MVGKKKVKYTLKCMLEYCAKKRSTL